MSDVYNNEDQKYLLLDTSHIFTKSVIYNNPIWDLGLQMEIKEINQGNRFIMSKGNTYTKKCICPCSSRFFNWHSQEGYVSFQGFNSCDDKIFVDVKTFLHRQHSGQGDFYHQIVLQIVQSYYSSILAKIKIFKTLTSEE